MVVENDLGIEQLGQMVQVVKSVNVWHQIFISKCWGPEIKWHIIGKSLSLSPFNIKCVNDCGEQCGALV